MENLQIWLRTPLRTFEAEIAQKIRTSSLSEKKGVPIKKRVYDIMCDTGNLKRHLLWTFHESAQVTLSFLMVETTKAFLAILSSRYLPNDTCLTKPSLRYLPYDTLAYLIVIVTEYISLSTH